MRFRILLILIFLLFTKPTYAGEAPILISPQDNTTTTSVKLEWQPPAYDLYPTNPYRIQVDNSSSFDSTEKDYYTTNTYYSPQLDENTWYWRVKAKAISGEWSNWSNFSNFTLSTSASPSPQTNPTPTNAPTPMPEPSATSQTESKISSFVLSNVPTSIDSSQSFSASLSLSLTNKPSTILYLKGAFRKSGSTNYFGLTKTAENWVKNSAAYTNQLRVETDSSGNWSGSIEIKTDPEDSGFSGQGEYLFKVGWYDRGSGPNWSNETTISVTHATNPPNSQSATQPPSPTPVTKIHQSNTSSIIQVTKPSIAPAPTNTNLQVEASIAGEATSLPFSQDTSDPPKSVLNWFTVPGIILLLIGGSIPVGLFAKNNQQLWKKLLPHR